MNLDLYAPIVTGLFPEAELVNAKRLTGGVSANVQKLDIRLPDGRSTSLVMRTHHPSYSGHPAELEYQLLTALHRAGLTVPEPLHIDVSGALLKDSYLLNEFVEGTSEIPPDKAPQYIDCMAEKLAEIHALPLIDLPALPDRLDPMPEIFDFMPTGEAWRELVTHLHRLTNTTYQANSTLLHGDFWPGNVLWRNDAIVSVIDWEDSAIGDPLSDVACCQLELRYLFGPESMDRFAQSYARYNNFDMNRLHLWQVYVASAAQCYMGNWGLDAQLEAHMRTEALAVIKEAGEKLMRQAF